MAHPRNEGWFNILNKTKQRTLLYKQNKAKTYLIISIDTKFNSQCLNLGGSTANSVLSGGD